jgi:sulfur-oxidizing protein SoxX
MLNSAELENKNRLRIEMTKLHLKINITLIAITLFGLTILSIFSNIAVAEETTAKSEKIIAKQSEKTNLEKGQELAFTRKKGNCLACHFVQGGDLTGNTGPALIAMKARFPKREDLYNQIFDARAKNTNTIMPPFGAHGALNKAEIELIVTWLYTL